MRTRAAFDEFGIPLEIRYDRVYEPYGQHKSL